MTIAGIDPKCYILALFVRDDRVRFLLGDDPYEFKDKQLHFQPNTVANDVVEVQGNDGYLLAGQVRRPGTQSFDGYVCNGTNSKAEVEVKRREFLQFFRRSHFYKVIYVFPNGTAIQRKQGFLVDDPTVQELYQQYPEYHVALNFEDVNYYTYEEDDQGQEIYAKEAIVPLAGGGATGGLIWDEYGVVWEDPWSDLVSVSGSEIQIDNEAGAMAPIQDLELQGDTYQNGTPTPDAPIPVQTVTGEQTVDVVGKNLCNINVPFPFTTSNGLTVDLDSDGFIVINGTASSNLNIIVSTDQLSFLQKYNGQQCTLSFESSGTGSVRNIGLKQDSGANIISVDPNSNPKTGTLNLASISTAKWQMWTVAGDSFTNYRIRPQFELGSIATAWEAFQSQSYIIELRGKNLLNISDFAMGGLTGGNPVVAYYRIQNANYAIAVQPNTTYTLSAQLVSPVQGFRVDIHEIDRNGVFLRDLGWKQLGTEAFTMTTNSDTYYLKMVGSLSTTSTDVTTGGTENTTVCATVAEFMRGCTLMLEKGSTATDYEPYNAIELCKIGDYQDYIYEDGDDWYVHKETEKIVLSGAEAWQLDNITTGYTRGVFNSGLNFAARDGYCNMLTVRTGSHGAYEYIFFQGTSATGAIYMQIKTSRLSANTLTAFKNWLSLHNATGYYTLATPTDTKITDATLIGQLEALGAMRLFIGENNLQVSATGSNLPATLEFSYPTKFAAIGAEWEEGGTKGATIVDVNAIDNTYPVWELTGPAVNPTLSVLTTNTTLTYNGTITASQKLVIDMFNKTATLNGTSMIGNVSGDFVYMAPGVNRIAYTAENNDAPDSTIYWQEVVG